MGGISQAQLVADIIKSLERQGVGRINARQMNAVVDAANAICLHLGIPHAPAVDGSGLTAWLASDDVGISSLAMAHVLCGVPRTARCQSIGGQLGYPRDPSDFGRCYRFLKAMPEAVPRLSKMADAGPVWAAYIAHWDELEDLWNEESPSRTCPTLYARMRSLREAAEDAAPKAQSL